MILWPADTKMCLFFCHSSNPIADTEVLTAIFFFPVYFPPLFASWENNFIWNSDVTMSEGQVWDYLMEGLIQPLVNDAQIPSGSRKSTGKCPEKTQIKGCKPWAKIGWGMNLISLQTPQLWENQQWGDVCSGETCRGETQSLLFCHCCFKGTVVTFPSTWARLTLQKLALGAKYNQVMWVWG